MKRKFKITVVGLGYVGLPLALELGKKYSTIGFDVDKSRIEQLKKKKDRNKEFTKKEFNYSKKLKFKSDLNDDNDTDIYIVTVPTPVTKKNNPDLSFVINACKLIGKKLKNSQKQTFEFLFKIRSYRGVRHKLKYPSRGQRTHTNAKTKQKFKF